VFILPFVIILSAFFLLLWTADLFFTLKSTEKKGRELEANPLMRWLLKERRAHLYVFKALEIICFFALIYIISFQNADYAVIILLIATGVYSLVVSNGMAFYLEIAKKPAVASRLLFLVCLAVLLFAYLAYETFANGESLFASCSKCCEDYAALKASCPNSGVPAGQSKTNDYGLNITLPG
jgi:hypothetical protein